MKATFLGTGCAMVLKRYNTCFLLEQDDNKLLVDAGGGNEVLVRLDKLGVPVTAIGGMFVTHSHSDHILGTPWVIRAAATAMEEEGYTGTFTVAGCAQTLSNVRTICEMILGKKLTKYFDSSRALDHVSLTVEPGRIVGLLGPNGSGKTTLIKLANGLLVPSSGAVTIDGHTPGPETKGLISYLPERTYLSGWMNVVQLLDFFGDFYPDFDRDAAEHMLSALDVSPRLRIKQMSKGTREKVQLILVMSRRARLYLLDEPIGGVDPATRDYIIHTILTNYNENASLVISTHLIADVENVLDDVIFINKGRVLLQQSVDQIRQEKGCSVDELFREVFRYAE